MGLKAILETIDDLPEETKSLYAETKVGDKTAYVLDVEDIDNHPKVRGVITANNENKRKRDEHKTRIEELEAKLTGFPEDFDADEYEQLKAGKSDKPDEAIQTLKDKHQRAIEQLQNKHRDELAARDTELGERDSYIDRTLVQGGLKDALIEIGVNPELLDGAMASLQSRVKVERDDNGDRKAIVETDLGDVGIADFVKEWAAGKGKPYLGKPSGPDARGNNGGNPRGTPKRSQMSNADKAAYIAEHGQEAFLKLPKS